MTWQPIETAPDNVEALFWVVAKTKDEASYCDTSGNPIFAEFKSYVLKGRNRGWSSLSKATHWMPIPPAPEDAPARTEPQD